jgi:hypothetical protein
MSSCLSVTGGSSQSGSSTESIPASCEPNLGLSGLGLPDSPAPSASELPPAAAAVEEIPARLGLTQAAVESRYPNLQPGDRIVFPDAMSPITQSPEAIGRLYGINAETMRQHNPYHSPGDPVAVPRVNDDTCMLKPEPEPRISKPEGVCEADLARAQQAYDQLSITDRVVAFLGSTDPVGLNAAERFQSRCEAMPDSIRESDFIGAQQDLAAYDAAVANGRYTLSARDAIALRDHVSLMRDVYTPTDGYSFEVEPSQQEQLYPQWQELRSKNDHDYARYLPWSAGNSASPPTGDVAKDLQAEEIRRVRLDFVMSVFDVLDGAAGPTGGLSSPTPGPPVRN